MSRARRDAHRAALALAAFAIATAGAGGAAASPTASTAGTAPCALIPPDVATRILGYAVADLDATAAAAGVCDYASRSLSEEGALVFSVVSLADVPARRAFYGVLARRCAGAAQASPGAGVCATYAALAAAGDLGAYYAARTSGPQSTPAAGIGERAALTPTALVVASGDRVVEVNVRHGDAIDVVRSRELAATLLRALRLPELPTGASPVPSAAAAAASVPAARRPSIRE